MTTVKKTLEKWLNNTPKYEPKSKVLAVLKRFFPGQYEQKSGSHIVIQDDKLKLFPDKYGPNGEFHIVITGGQRVKGFYLKDLAKTIKLLEELQELEV
jgi:hypothetical protein